MYGDCPPSVITAAPTSYGAFAALASDVAQRLDRQPVWVVVAKPRLRDLEALMPRPGVAIDGVDVLAAHLDHMGLPLPRRRVAEAGAPHVGSGLVAGDAADAKELARLLGVPVEAWQPSSPLNIS